MMMVTFGWKSSQVIKKALHFNPRCRKFLSLCCGYHRVRKVVIPAKTPSLGKGSAACEVAGRGFVRFAFSLNPSLPLPGDGITRGRTFEHLPNTCVVTAPTRAVVLNLL